MRFVSLVNSAIGKARRAISQTSSVSEEDVKDTGKLAENLRQIVARVNKLEAALQPEATEFEVNLPDSGTLVELPHGFKTTSVRWTVVGWFSQAGGVSPTEAPRLVYDSSSTALSLFLRSYIKGRAIIRVEPAQSFLDPGPTIDGFGTPPGGQSVRVTYSSTAAQVAMLIPIPDNSISTYRVTILGQSTTTLSSRLINVIFFHARRQLSAGTIDLVTGAILLTATAGMTATFAVSGNNVSISVQNTTVGNTTNWTIKVEPIHSYLRDEP